MNAWAARSPEGGEDTGIAGPGNLRTAPRCRQASTREAQTPGQGQGPSEQKDARDGKERTNSELAESLRCGSGTTVRASVCKSRWILRDALEQVGSEPGGRGIWYRTQRDTWNHVPGKILIIDPSA